MNGERVIEAGRPGRAAWRLRRKGIAERELRGYAICLVVLAEDANVARVDGPSGDEREAQRAFDEASPAAAQYGLLVAIGTPCKSQPRAVVVLVGVAERLRQPRLLRGEGLRGSDGVHEVCRLERLRFRIRHYYRAVNHRPIGSRPVVIRQEERGVVVDLF